MHAIDWNHLPDEVQLAMSREALRRAVETLVFHAELLATEISDGSLADRGGPDALRLFPSIVRFTQADISVPVGHA